MSTTYPRAPKRPERITAIENNIDVEKRKNDIEELDRKYRVVHESYLYINGYCVGNDSNVPSGAWGYIQMLREQLYDARKRIEWLEMERGVGKDQP